MNLMPGWIDRLRGNGVEGGVCADADDGALSQRMRDAAVRLHASGRTRLRLTRAELRAVRAAACEADALRRRGVDGGAPLKHLVENARLMESCAEQARLDGVRGLPAAGGEARIGACSASCAAWAACA